MQRLRHILRTCLVLAMIPLTVFNGRATAGCICSDGHFELFCRGGGCCSGASKNQQTGFCGCGKCCGQSKPGTKKSCFAGKGVPSGCAQHSESDKPGNCCHPLTHSPMVANQHFAPQIEIELLAFDHTVAVSLPPAVVEQFVSVQAVDSGPPRERLQLLQRWLT
jgi:hypothetical protein